LLLTLVTVVQATAMPFVTFAGVKPDLMLVTVVSWSLLRGTRDGAIWGFTGGLLLDLFSGAPLGSTTCTLTLVGALSGIGQASIFRANLALLVLAVAGATLAYNALLAIILTLLGWPIDWGDMLTLILPPAMGLNILLLPLVYPFLRWLHRITGRPEIGW